MGAHGLPISETYLLSLKSRDGANYKEASRLSKSSYLRYPNLAWVDLALVT